MRYEYDTKYVTQHEGIIAAKEQADEELILLEQIFWTSSLAVEDQPIQASLPKTEWDVFLRTPSCSQV